MDRNVSLSDGEWKLMNLLWEESPRTIGQLVSALKDDTGWTKGTVFMMLSRMADKGAARCDGSGRPNLYYPVLKRRTPHPMRRRAFSPRSTAAAWG